VVVSAESALPEVVGEAGASVAGEDLAAGVTTVLSWPEPARRAAARARAEHFGWPAAVRAFLAIHEALVADEARGGDRLAADVAEQGGRLAADEAGGRDQVADGVAAGAGRRGQVTDGVAAGAGAGTGVRTERRPT